MRVFWIALGALLMACIQPDAVQCGELLCGPGSVCTSSGCALLAEAEACAALPEQGACRAPGIAHGICLGGACRVVVCGDGVRTPGEACDDGNTASGDGCSSNCASDETCGNGVRDPNEACDDGNAEQRDGCHADCTLPACGDRVVDTQYGEVCDDGNTIDGDGCAAGCRSSELCGNGLIDAHVGEACDDGNLVDGDGCQHTCQVPRCGDSVVDAQFAEACDDGNLVDGDGCAANCRSDERCGNGFIDVGLGEACDDGAANSNAPDAACRPNCRVRSCGDGVVDAGEVCDDGNTVDGTVMEGIFVADACAANCASAQVCGNGYVDLVAHEQCDDAGLAGLSGDGCASTCELEQSTWRDVSWRETPADCINVAYDPGLPAIACLGDNRMYRYSEEGWRVAEHAPLPPRAWGRVIAANGAAGGVVVFGGFDPQSGALMTDTWRYNGSYWAEVPSTLAPLGRMEHALAYDQARGRYVLFGGYDPYSEAILDDLWELVGDEWQLSEEFATRPVARTAPAMAYDPRLGAMLVFGGNDGVDGNLQDTWRYDAGGWRRLVTAHAPLHRYGAAMAYDADAQTMWLFGGRADAGWAADLWQFDGQDWRVTDVMLPVALTRPTLAYDRFRHRLVLTGLDTDLEDTRTFELVGGQWQERGYRFGLYAYDGFLTADTKRGRLILHGDMGTWAMSGHAWQPATTHALPPPRSESPIAYDQARDRVVLFGGYDQTFHLDDTWEFDGTTWHERAMASAPSARRGHALAYDVARGVVVLFGGYQRSAVWGEEATTFDDTWEYNGTTWAHRDVAGPVARHSATMAYHERLQMVVLFGGVRSDEERLNDTWVYNGVAWTRRELATVPTPRFAASLAFDRALGRMVLFGGQTDTYAGLADAWELLDDRWRPMTVALAPPAMLQPSVAWHEARRELIMFGHSDVGSTATWSLRYGLPASPLEACVDATVDGDGDGLAGCADPDCWYRCTPGCTAYGQMQSLPQAQRWPQVCAGARCGDGTCQALEDKWLCPVDCE